MVHRKRKYDGGGTRDMGMKQQQPYAPGVSPYGAMPGEPNMMYPAGGFWFPYQPPPFPVVRLRGLPFDCSEGDVVDFFQGLDLLDILFVHQGGRFTGDAFCMFGYPFQVDFAVQRNRQNIGRRYIEVYRCDRDDYYTAIAQEISSGKVRGSSPRRSAPPARRNPSSDGSKDDHLVSTSILRMRGLPFSAGKEEIIDFFKDFELTKQRVHLVVNPNGCARGEAFVEFNSVEDAKGAMKNDRMALGSRYIELFPSHMQERDKAISRERG